MGDRSPHAAGREVARARENPTVPAGPRLVQGVGEQGKSARLSFDVGQHGVDQPGLESQSRRTGGALDRPAQLVRLHRAEQALMRGHCPGQARVLRAASVEVRAEGDDDRGGAPLAQVDQGVEEAPPARFVRTEGERLLELVDDEERRRTVRPRVSAPPPDPGLASSPPRDHRERGEKPE